MSRLTVIGGTGYAGGYIVAEAARRGHRVIAYSRNAPGTPIAGVEYRQADVSNLAVLQAATDGADVVVSALSPRGDLGGAGQLRRIDSRLAQLAKQSGFRVGIVGGSGSLLAFEGGPYLIDTDQFPADAKPSAIEMGAILEDLRSGDPDVDWFYVSPAPLFGAWNPGNATGKYRIGGEVLLVGADGS
ncbi:NAD(P)-dependent oxidoreductase, partial [Mesorhizobium japonicum]|uniref:NAD(P)-dependent oxidoreductase n=1 Tax=Mesorhizobium japonicum TaxID=2066070 RepID=UPI003B5B07BC